MISEYHSIFFITSTLLEKNYFNHPLHVNLIKIILTAIMVDIQLSIVDFNFKNLRLFVFLLATLEEFPLIIIDLP